MENTNISMVHHDDIALQMNQSAYFHSPEFLAFNFIMVFAVLLPAAFLDTAIIASILSDRSTIIQLKTVLVNLLAGNLAVVCTLTVQHVTAIILLTTEAETPPLPFCSVITWMMGSGGGLRLLFTAVFALMVFVMIKYSAAPTKKWILIAMTITCWIGALLISSPLLVPVVIDSRFYGGVSCYVYSSEKVNRKLLAGFVGLWVLILGIIPFIITTVVPIIGLYYISKNQVTDDVVLKKAMAKFALFLMLGNSLNFLGQVVPPVISFLTKQSTEMFYTKTVLTLVLMGFSLLPTPIIMIAYLKSVRERLMKLFCHFCKTSICPCNKSPDQGSKRKLQQQSSFTTKSSSAF